MKHCRYHPEFNWQVYGAAEKRADQYWKQRKLLHAINNSNGENEEQSHKLPAAGKFGGSNVSRRW